MYGAKRNKIYIIFAFIPNKLGCAVRQKSSYLNKIITSNRRFFGEFKLFRTQIHKEHHMLIKTSAYQQLSDLVTMF